MARTNLKNNQEETTAKFKKLITISRINEVTLNGLLKDTAYLEDSTESRIIEDVLIDKLYLKSVKAQRYITEIYTVGIKKTFIELFDELSAGTFLESTYENAKPLVEFAFRNSSNALHGLSEDQFAYHDFISNCDTITEILKFEAEQEEAGYKMKIEYEHVSGLVNQLPKFFVPLNFVGIILRNWNVLKTSIYSYRLLSDVIVLTEGELTWRETPENRLEARRLIEKVVSEWDR